MPTAEIHENEEISMVAGLKSDLSLFPIREDDTICGGCGNESRGVLVTADGRTAVACQVCAEAFIRRFGNAGFAERSQE